MSSEANYLDITLLGKEYRVACPVEERAALLAAVAYVDDKMHDIAEKTRSNISERIAVMAALNIAHEYLTHHVSQDAVQLTFESERGLDFTQAQRRIQNMEARLDAVLDEPESPA